MQDKTLKDLKGMGEKTLFYLNQANIFTIHDLINTLPKHYENFNLNQKDIFVAKIISDIKQSDFRIPKASFKVEINNLSYQAVAFQRPYLKFLFKKGDECIIKAHIHENKIINIVSIKPIHKLDTIESSYQIKHVLDHRIRKMISDNFALNNIIVNESLSPNILKQYDLMSLRESYEHIHNPKSIALKEQALFRLKVEEAIEFYKRIEEKKVRPIRFQTIDEKSLRHMLDTLPFALTDDQHHALDAIMKDFNGYYIMERLIQGDVGSGKTIVAFISAMMVIELGYQVAFMSPTEVLSEQHYQNFKNLFPHIKVANISSMTSKKVIEDIRSLNVNMVFGTHKLAYPNVEFSNLSLVIIDEQHKFGVDIRKKLREKSKTFDLLYLTATPIPRSLMHIMYGHASLSSIKTIPQGRGKVSSFVLHMNQLEDVHKQIEKAIIHKQHVYVVAPAIHYSEMKTSILSVYPQFKKKYEDDLYVLHGDMTKEDQLETIEKFKASKGGVLLSTTMIEVGIDIKTATFMIVLDADNFGVSQLHQLRGRIGRGELKGVFYMLSQNPDHQRLNLVSKTQDGFILSEEDLKLRGAGDLLGFKQSGNVKLNMNDYIEDYDVFMFVKKILEEHSII